AWSPCCSVSRVYPVRSRKQIAGLSEAPEAVARHAERTLDGGVRDPLCELDLEQRDHCAFVAAHAVVRARRCEAHRVADDKQEFERHSAAFADLEERGAFA